MRPLEDELRAALRRQEPPARLEEKVLAAVRGERVNEAFHRPRVSRPAKVFRWVAAAVAACAITVVLVVQRRQERQRREEARREALLGLRIARREMNQALAVAFHASNLDRGDDLTQSSINSKEQP